MPLYGGVAGIAPPTWSRLLSLRCVHVHHIISGIKHTIQLPLFQGQLISIGGWLLQDDEKIDENKNLTSADAIRDGTTWESDGMVLWSKSI